ncbi:MAG: hypothetical protein O2962_09200 [Cyanobacteria bacterium]|nr:hypothetical protein [Cyanobacteriota bacterium]
MFGGVFMGSNIANTPSRSDGLMTRLKDNAGKTLRTVILSGSALLAPDIAENVLPVINVNQTSALHAADEPQVERVLALNNNNESKRLETCEK